MENEEKNIEQNKELSLQEKLEAQDEFAFLDDDEFGKEDIQEGPSIDALQENTMINDDSQEENEQEDDDSFDLFTASKELDSQEENEDIQEEIKQVDEFDNEEIIKESFQDFSDDKAFDETIEKPEIEPQACVSFQDDTKNEPQEVSSGLITVRPVKFQEFENTPPNRTIKKNLDLIQDVTMHVSVELGRTKSSIREVMALEKASIVELDKIAGELVEIFVNQKLVAKGEVIVIEDKFGVRVTSTTSPKTE